MTQEERGMMTNEAETLGDALPARMKQIREVYIPAYQEIGPTGGFAIALMQNDLSAAEKAMASGDLVGMIAAYKSLMEYKL